MKKKLIRITEIDLIDEECPDTLTLRECMINVGDEFMAEIDSYGKAWIRAEYTNHSDEIRVGDWLGICLDEYEVVE